MPVSSIPSRLDTSVQYLKGVGPKAAQVLAKLGVETVKDLLYYLPFRYEDRRDFRPIGSVRPGEWVTLKGRVVSLDSRNRQGNFTIIRAAIADGSGAIGLIWFNQRWIKTQLDKHEGEIIVYGQVKEGNYGYEIASPEWETVDPADDVTGFARLTPIYRLTEGLSQKLIRKAALSAVTSLQPKDIEETLPEEMRKANRLQPLIWSIKQVHFPDTEESRVAARRRLVFEEFFVMQLGLAMRRAQTGEEPGIAFEVSSAVIEDLRSALHFEFTAAQTRVIEEIYSDMRRPHPMNRLLQGDVGSGKTAVAAAAMLAAVRSGYQAALMAPTEILAEQHFVSLHQLFEGMGVRVDLLVGKQTAKQKKQAIDRTTDGSADIAIGTHALIQEGVAFNKLGLVVVDEQHRFGVLQRGALRQKGHGNPDVLVMTATPIPRSLTLTLYGDLDLSVLDEMPPGRIQIKTHWKLPAERNSVYEGVRKLLHEGAQAYMVCPLVSESEKMLAQAANELYLRMSQMVFPEFRVGLLHGQLKTKEKEQSMEAFRRHEIDVLVSTTVIEVGVDVPNASIMVIEDANRFGLSQLHQLRGRVGRGERQSFCVLIGAANNSDAEARLRVMVETSDGFRISEEDLRIRGPGELYGTRQSGELELRVADLLQDGKVLQEARQAATTLVSDDPRLSRPEHARLAVAVRDWDSRVASTDVS
ncbi:MAG: ATP-dependent DNA helicase RecG [Armatimonadetes bacterium]|nr:ATP-dependent DNA helicase RecG [Armatimonadota bacterium]